MSLFGTSPTENERNANLPSTPKRSGGGGGGAGGLFNDEPSSGKGSSANGSSGLFADDGGHGQGGGGDDSSPWDMPTPRKRQSRAEMIRSLLPAGDVPESYIDAFDTVVKRRGGGSGGGRLASNDDVAAVFAAARLGSEAQARVVSLLSDGSSGDGLALGRSEFNVLLALVGLAQEGEVVSLDGVDERRRNLPQPKLAGLNAEPVLPRVDELSAKPPQTPVKDEPRNQQHGHARQSSQPKIMRPALDDPEDDPWNTPEVRKNNAQGPVKPAPNGNDSANGHGSFDDSPTSARRTMSQYTVETTASSNEPSQNTGSGPGPVGGWGYFDGSGNNSNNNNNSEAPGSGFNAGGAQIPTSPFGGGDGSGRAPGNNPLGPSPASRLHTPGGGLGENIVVNLMPEKEGVFMFQHHNYEVASQRRGSKVVRRYSDFVWLLDCMQKRYPFRVLPLLPPKRMAVNGNHLSNDTAFIEKRRRGLARFLNALVRHPVLGQEQLVVMFLTVPTELAVWRKQATISVQDEFADKAIPPGLEDSLPSTLEDLFARTRTGVRRSAELYTNVCNIMNRLIRRSEGVAADHGRVATSLASLSETSSDTYATDTNEVALLNDGLAAMNKHLETCQTLMEDECRGWDEGVLEDLKRQRDALVSVQELFERRERLDKDNIPYLERRIQTNETKLASLRSKPEGTVKPGEIEKVAEAIIKDKESIVQQHNRSIFVKDTIREELVTFQSTQYNVSRWNQEWAGERVKYSEMLADNWRRLLDDLDGMPLGD